MVLKETSWHQVFHGKPQITNLRMSRDDGLEVAFAVCSLQFTVKLRAVGGLRQVFFPDRNCTASPLMAQRSILYPPVRCVRFFNSNQSMFNVCLGDRSDAHRLDEM